MPLNLHGVCKAFGRDRVFKMPLPGSASCAGMVAASIVALSFANIWLANAGAGTPGKTHTIFSLIILPSPRVVSGANSNLYAGAAESLFFLRSGRVVSDCQHAVGTAKSVSAFHRAPYIFMYPHHCYTTDTQSGDLNKNLQPLDVREAVDFALSGVVHQVLEEGCNAARGRRVRNVTLNLPNPVRSKIPAAVIFLKNVTTRI